MVTEGHEYRPTEANRKVYTRLYSLYRQLHDGFGVKEWSGGMHNVMKELLDIRDPFVLLDQGCYYLYGTRGTTVWTQEDRFDCYTSDDLATWDGPHEIFHRAPDFWADRSFWAPECHAYEGAYYLLTTFGSGDGRLGVQILRAESPLGPFAPWSNGTLTPPEWQCLDGTPYFDAEGAPHLVFSRSFRQVGEGHMCAVEMTPDLRTTRGEPRVLFSAKDAPWVVPFPFAEDFGIETDVYLSDGPFPHTTRSGQLLLLWSSFGANGYTVGIARSASGDFWGPWEHDAEPLFAGDVGHCMVFRTREGKLLLALHAPNTFGEERPRFLELTETDAGLSLGEPARPAKGGSR